MHHTPGLERTGRHETQRHKEMEILSQLPSTHHYMHTGIMTYHTALLTSVIAVVNQKEMQSFF